MTTTHVPTVHQLSAGDGRTARQAGLLYLGLAVTGLASYLVIRSQIFVADDPSATLAHLVDHEGLARVGIAAELGVVLTQALVAVWFFRLFRGVSVVAGGSLAAFGLVNAVAILTSAAAMATALDVAVDADLAGAGAGTVEAQLLYLLSGHLWILGGLFFGLWLIPMGWLVRESGWMPDLLGWILIAGGFGYVLSAFTAYLLPDAGLLADLLTAPASIGEFWMIGYLLVRGVRRVG